MPKVICRLAYISLAYFLVSSSVYSWNGFGHRTVAKIACLEIRDGQQKAIFNLLKNHPHFAVLKDFPKDGQDTSFFGQGRPPGVREVEWAIFQATTWPEFVRVPRFSKLTAQQIQTDPVHKYDRKFDHFADIALVDPNFKQMPKEDNPGSLLEAFAKAEKRLKDPNLPLSDKAIAFCWLAHLAEDIHQPLHCTILFSKRFPNGDGGGNAFPIGKTNLHSFCDEVLGAEHTTFEYFDAVANGIHRAPQLQRSKLLEMKQNTSYRSWADESDMIAARLLTWTERTC